MRLPRLIWPWGLTWPEIFARDVRFALRGMRNNPGFATVVIASLAFGIGATTAVFSVVYAILLRPLPYREPDRLVMVTLSNPAIARLGYPDLGVSLPIYERLRQDSKSVEESAVFSALSLNLASQREPERISAARVSGGLFRLLGVQPRLGRSFTPEEDQVGHNDVVLIGDSLWTRHFGRDPRVLGHKVLLNGAPHTIIGVMPQGFQFPGGPEMPYFRGAPAPTQIWRPLAAADWERTGTGSLNFAMIARLRPGSSPQQTRAEMSRIAAYVAQQVDAGTDWGVHVRTVLETITRNVRPAVWTLFGAVAVVLLIACANVANLLIARGVSRRGEIAVRLSLGAGPARVVRQLLTEGLVFAVCAAVAALPVAYAGMRILVTLAPGRIARIESATIDWRVLLFAASAAIGTVLLFGLAPALETVQSGIAPAMQGIGRALSPAPSRLRPALVAGQFGLAVVLLVGAVLLAKSFLAVTRMPLGFHSENVLTMQVTNSQTTDENHERHANAIGQLVERCSMLPGVVEAAAVSTLPLWGQGDGEGRGTVAEENRHLPASRWAMLRYRSITPAYFRTLGIALRRGREFTAWDRGQSGVAILSESAARLLWPGGQDPIGRRLVEGSRPPMTVVGVVADTRASGIDSEVRPYLYVPIWQFLPDEFALAVRSRGDPAGLTAALKAEVWRWDKNTPVTHVATMQQYMADAIAPRRFPAVVMGAFAGFALLLAAVGLYGVMSYAVAQKRHEIGIRMALGATSQDVVMGVVRQAGVLCLAGVAGGLAVARGVAPLLRNLLFGVRPLEPWVFVGCALALLAVAAFASILPARRAARLDPVSCLRHE